MPAPRYATGPRGAAGEALSSSIGSDTTNTHTACTQGIRGEPGLRDKGEYMSCIGVEAAGNKPLRHCAQADWQPHLYSPVEEEGPRLRLDSIQAVILSGLQQNIEGLETVDALDSNARWTN